MLASQHGIDSRLITFLPSKPFEKIGIQADGDRLLPFRHDHSRVFPEILVGRPRIRIGFGRPGTLLLHVAPSLGRFGCASAILFRGPSECRASLWELRSRFGGSSAGPLMQPFFLTS